MISTGRSTLRVVLVSASRNGWVRGLGSVPTDDPDPRSPANLGLAIGLLRRYPDIHAFWKTQEMVIYVDSSARFPVHDLLYGERDQ
jgi:hypothetical protein